MANRAEIWGKKKKKKHIVSVGDSKIPIWLSKPSLCSQYLGFPQKHHRLEPSLGSWFMKETVWPEKSSWWGCSVDLQSWIAKTSPRFLRFKGKPDYKNTEKAADWRL